MVLARIEGPLFGLLKTPSLQRTVGQHLNSSRSVERGVSMCGTPGSSLVLYKLSCRQHAPISPGLPSSRGWFYLGKGRTVLRLWQLGSPEDGSALRPCSGVIDDTVFVCFLVFSFCKFHITFPKIHFDFIGSSSVLSFHLEKSCRETCVACLVVPRLFAALRCILCLQKVAVFLLAADLLSTSVS